MLSQSPYIQSPAFSLPSEPVASISQAAFGLHHSGDVPQAICGFRKFQCKFRPIPVFEHAPR
jgi:hypothetical protein